MVAKKSERLKYYKDAMTTIPIAEFNRIADEFDMPVSEFLRRGFHIAMRYPELLKEADEAEALYRERCTPNGSEKIRVRIGSDDDLSGGPG